MQLGGWLMMAAVVIDIVVVSAAASGVPETACDGVEACSWLPSANSDSQHRGSRSMSDVAPTAATLVFPESKMKAVATSDGAGVSLFRSIGTRKLDMLDPFLMLDSFRSDDPDDYIAGFPNHPHRGFNTITYMLEGNMRHRDSYGNNGLLTSGGVQVMKAACGVVHSEMPEQVEGVMSGFQLWVNLPSEEKMSAFEYRDFDPSEFSWETLGSGAKVKVIAGAIATSEGEVLEGPAPDYGDRGLQYYHLILEKGQSVEFEFPGDTHNGFAYHLIGGAVFGDEETKGGHTEVEEHTIVVFRREQGRIRVRGTSDVPAQFIFVAGIPTNEPVARAGPFVMSTEAELRQAYADHYAGRLGQPSA